MDYPESVEYVRENLGIYVSPTTFDLKADQIQQIVDKFPYRGILLVTGNNHLINSGILCASFLRAGKISGSIVRLESWETGSVFEESADLMLCTNITEDLAKPAFIISLVTSCMRLNIPMMFTTPLTIEVLESSLPISLISNIVPYLFGKL